MALVRAAESEQDAAIYLTAAFTGLRQGELLALRCRDVDLEREHRGSNDGRAGAQNEQGRRPRMPDALGVPRSRGAGSGSPKSSTSV